MNSKKYILFILCCLNFISLLSSYYKCTEILDCFRNYLEKGTLDNQDWSLFTTKPKSRYHTFKHAFEHFEKNNGKIIVELGTTRSFTDGAFPGCNSDNPIYWTPDDPEKWDWGAGCFTLMASHCLAHVHPKIYTVDISSRHIQRCKLMTEKFQNIMHYRVMSSLDFLKECNFTEGIDLIYLDTGDMTPIEPTALLQLQEVKIIIERDLLSENGLILIDDVKNQTPRKFGDTTGLGKSKYSLPYLLEHGYEIIIDEYQVLLKKTK